MERRRFWALLIPVLWCLSAPPAVAAGNADHHDNPMTIHLRFDSTDVSDVLQALSLKTHTNIVFSSQAKHPISVNIAASTPDEALRYVTAAAGLSYRMVGRTYVVAAPADLRAALEPFGERAMLHLNSMKPDTAAQMLQSACPYLTVRPAGDQVLAIGAADDIAQARALLDEEDKPVLEDPEANDLVLLQHAPADKVVGLLKAIYPDIRADSVGATGKPGGAVGLAGPRSEVEKASAEAKAMDASQDAQPPGQEFRLYTIKYSSASYLKSFLSKADPDVTVLVGPAPYAPTAPGFHPISGASVGSSSVAGGNSLSGGSTGGSGSSGGYSPEQAGPAGAPGTPGAAGSDTAADMATTLVLEGQPAALDSAIKLLDTVDIAPEQVMIDVKVVDTSPEQAEQLGINWNWQPMNFIQTPDHTLLGPQTFQPQPLSSIPLGNWHFSMAPWQIQNIISALATRKEAKILADPRIEVTDNQDASIFIGQTIRTQVSQASLAGTTVQVLEFPVGIILLVRPRVNADGEITMHVHPVVSTITGFGPNNLPQSSSREAETTVMVHDGQTMVIGGLIQDEMSKTVQEIPILSKIPIIGELFRTRSTDHTHSDVMIFITPHILH